MADSLGASPSNDRSAYSSGRLAVVLNWRDPADAAAGGSERYVWEAAQALRAAGFDVEFVTARVSGRPRRETVEGIAVVRTGGRWGVYPGAARVLLAHRLPRRQRIDLVIDTENGIPFFAPWWVRRGVPVVLLMHHVHLDQFAVHFPGPLALVGRTVERRVMPWAYRRATTVAVSESTRAEMVRRLGWSRPVRVVHNGTAAPTSPLGRRPLHEPPRLLVLGRLVAHKRVDRVVAAVGAARQAGRVYRLDVVGTGPELARLRAQVASLGLLDCVTIHGWVSDTERDALLDRADLHVCVSDGEGWGQVVLDAAGRGLPTLATDVPGLRDVVCEGDTGWLLRPGETLAAGIERALSALATPAGRYRFDAACRARAQQFPWSRMRQEFREAVTAP